MARENKVERSKKMESNLFKAQTGSDNSKVVHCQLLSAAIVSVQGVPGVIVYQWEF